MGTHLQSGTFEVPAGVNVDEAVQKIWEAGGYVRLRPDAPNAIDVTCATGIYPQIRNLLQPTGGLDESGKPNVAEGNEAQTT